MKYGLIGEKLSHSFSKEIHEALAPYTYEICEIERAALAAFIRTRDFCAINVTIPYKADVIPLLDEVDATALEIGAVNTVVNRGGRLYGYNTDQLGLRDLILRSGTEISGKKVLILGTGGTSRTSDAVCRELGAREIIRVSRAKINGAVTYGEAYELHTDAQIIINTTPVGMYPSPDASPIELEPFSKLEAVFDAVYNPLRTSLVLKAKERGIVAEGGLYMLVSQAVHASALFLDRRADPRTTEEIYQKILKQKENIVLIGMPASGKTTVGRIVASKTERELLDLDDEIEKRIGMTIADYFREHTENDFRDVESEITQNISKRNGIVIATGGGVILREDNIRALRQNGRLYFVDRSLSSLLPTESRPLARSAAAIEALYRARYDIYRSAADVKIDADDSPEAVADKIREEFKG